VNVALIEKSTKGVKLILYSASLALMESESFDDLYTLNFYMQTLAKKHGIEKGLQVVHDKDKNSVSLSIAQNEDSFFIS
jgi:hypothetical protein